jgi:1-acyl-sn-glycerol-3-phosphate acyltransferase
MPPFESPPYPARPQPSPFAYGPAAEPGLAYACAWSFLKLYNLLFIHEIRARRPAELPAMPKIIASNHPNATDGFVLPFVFPDEKLSVLAQASVFRIPVLGGWLAGAGGIPVVKGRPDSVLDAAQRRIGQGYSVYICPEGRLNQGGALGRGHTGAVRLALASGVPIVPVGFYVPPRHVQTFSRTAGGRVHTGRWQMGGPIYVEIGEAWWPGAELAGRPAARDYRKLTDRLMAEIGALTRQAEERASLQLE